MLGSIVTEFLFVSTSWKKTGTCRYGSTGTSSFVFQLNLEYYCSQNSVVERLFFFNTRSGCTDLRDR